MLNELHEKFIDYYLQTLSIEESAKKAGIKEDPLTAGINLLANKEIQEALEKRAREFDEATKALKLTKERFISIMMFQYEKANRFNKTKEAADILSRIAEMQGINLNEVKMEPVNLIINNLDPNKI